MPTLSPAPIERVPLRCSDSDDALVCSDLLEATDADGLAAAAVSTGTLVAA